MGKLPGSRHHDHHHHHGSASHPGSTGKPCTENREPFGMDGLRGRPSKIPGGREKTTCGSGRSVFANQVSSVCHGGCPRHGATPTAGTRKKEKCDGGHPEAVRCPNWEWHHGWRLAPKSGPAHGQPHEWIRRHCRSHACAEHGRLPSASSRGRFQHGRNGDAGWDHPACFSTAAATTTCAGARNERHAFIGRHGAGSAAVPASSAAKQRGHAEWAGIQARAGANEWNDPNGRRSAEREPAVRERPSVWCSPMGNLASHAAEIINFGLPAGTRLERGTGWSLCWEGRGWDGVLGV